MGTPEFAVPSLAILHRAGYHIPAVVTGVDKPRGRGQIVSPTPVKRLATTLGLRVLQPPSLKDPEIAAQIQDLNPDLIVVVAFRILPPQIFGIPRLGAFNLHASLLPKYRGAAPINWAIIEGETETGLTTFLLQAKVDTGSILLRKSYPILPDDDAGSLHDRLAGEGATLVLETAKLLEGGKAKPVQQDDAEATPAPKIQKSDCRLDWSMPAARIHNRIRGLSPFPGATTTHRGKTLKVYRSQILQTPSIGPEGTVSISHGSLIVSTGDFHLAIAEIQLEGKKRMKADEFLRGYRIGDGERFE